MSPQELDELLHLTTQVEKDLKVWKPLPGPQLQAYQSNADVLFYGGAAGGGKTDLLLGLAHTLHNRTAIFRREFTQLKGIEDRAAEIFRGLGDYNISNKIWRFFDGRQIEFGAVSLENDKEKYQGRAHDLKSFDEITHFTKTQFDYIITWNRSTVPGQRCRIVCTGNPPTTAEGDWVIDYWGPWLDEKHPFPAAPGELRYYTNIDGKDVECADGEPILHKGEWIKPISRTFIPAKIDDNPYLRDSGYKNTLQALPKELRNKFLHGNFSSTREDDPWQVIPSEWVLLAQERWRRRGKPQSSLTAIGADVARGGNDNTVLTMRYGTFFDEQLVYPGSSTPDGPTVASLIIAQMQFGTIVNVDIIGVGTSVYDTLVGHKVETYALNGACASDAVDKTNHLSFVNKRAEWYWKLRESLNPETGDEIALPPDRELLADLCAPRWELTTRGILVEKKSEIIKRIGRSPDKGDSLVYAHALEKSSLAFGSLV